MRQRILADDAVWSEMDRLGNVAVFSTIPALGARWFSVATDWTDIRWWSGAMVEIAPRLAEMLAAGQDADFESRRKKLAGALAGVTRNAHAAFVGGWGLAVMFALSDGSAAAAIDIAAEPQPASYNKGILGA